MEKLEEELRYTFGIVNNWVKFAEAKNGALLAIAAGVVSAMSARLHPSVLTASDLILFFCVILFSLSGLVALFSFFPRLKDFELQNLGDCQVDDNPFYYGDIAKYDADGYLRLLSFRLDDSVGSTRLHVDLAKQVIVNSKIALLKYRQFMKAIRLAIGGLLTMMVYVVAIIL
ncbi:MAG: DUF5706 domain-containing protein [Desulfoplanes sp.]|nr:DUF5706 domain-containing protein [Desulfoplanes sp.]